MYLVANTIAKEHISSILFNANYSVMILLGAIEIPSSVAQDRQVQVYQGCISPCLLNQLFPIKFLSNINDRLLCSQVV